LKEFIVCLGIPGKVIEIYEASGLKMGKIDFGGVVKEACLAYVPDIAIGEYTIVHVGFAISQIDEEEARATLELLREMDALAGELPETASQGDAS
jgi:hydrogenase expression/formation protein HypC